MDRIETLNIVCNGGLDVTADLLSQGLNQIGSARRLTNYEPAERQGYIRIGGFSKFSETEVPGDTDAPVVGVQPAFEGTFAARKNGVSTDIYYGTGTTWSKINSANKTGTITQVRFAVYNLFEEVTIITDGVNPALKYNGTTDTSINGDGAPANPKYADLHLSRLVLAGYGTGSALSLSVPNNDEDFTGAKGAIEVNVGDEIVGIKSFREILYIFCRNSIKKLEGTSASNFIIRDVTTQIGCIEADTIREIAGDLIFLAPDGLRSLAATERIGDVDLGLQSRPINDKVQDAINLNPTLFTSCVIPSKSQYRLFYYQDGTDAESQKGFLGRVKATEAGSGYQWAETLGIPVYSCGNRIINNDEIVVFGHITNGFVYQMDIGGSFDGQPVPFEYRTPPLVFNDLNVRKVLHRARLTIRSQQDTSVNVRAILDEYYKEFIQPSSKLIEVEGDGVVFGGAGVTFGDVEFAGDATPYVESTRMEGSGYTITLDISGSNTDLPHQIDDIVLEFATKGRR